MGFPPIREVDRAITEKLREASGNIMRGDTPNQLKYIKDVLFATVSELEKVVNSPIKCGVELDTECVWFKAEISGEEFRSMFKWTALEGLILADVEKGYYNLARKIAHEWLDEFTGRWFFLGEES